MIAKTISTPYGDNAEVWKWDGNATPAGDGKLTVTMLGYVSSDALAQGLQPITSYEIEIPSGVYPDEASIDAAVLAQQSDLAGGTQAADPV